MPQWHWGRGLLQGLYPPELSSPPASSLLPPPGLMFSWWEHEVSERRVEAIKVQACSHQGS